MCAALPACLLDCPEGCGVLNYISGVQENAAKPEGLHPSQGGKYVGFGSAPAPAPRRQGSGGSGGGGVGIDDVTSVLSKGFSQLSTVAGACPPLLARRGVLTMRWLRLGCIH